ncbi:MAG: squalene--hopene cyclase [bacterium]
MSSRNGHPFPDQVIEARDALKSLQKSDGHWIFEFEADAAISSEYIFLQHFLDEIDAEEERKIAAYLRNIQAGHGGWPLFTGGNLDLSATVKAYYALKLAGDDPEEPHMRRAREEILARGGAARTTVFTRISLALFGQVSWTTFPVMPIELMLLPKSSLFHYSKVSYWSRTVIVPLLILMALKPRARNPRGIEIGELFTAPPEKEQSFIANPTGTLLGTAFVGLDKLIRLAEPIFPQSRRKKAIEAAVAFITERLNGEDGMGGIFPAMANTVMAFDALGYSSDHPHMAVAKRAVKRLLLMREDHGYCQPCLSPTWDTALATYALMEAGEPPEDQVLEKACHWLLEREITDTPGDWSWNRPSLEPSGWAFQYRNDHYPDTDDTAMVIMALHRADPVRYREAIERSSKWVLGMQSKTGGWGAFDAENGHHYLNNIPFADHGALLDPPTADVTARCLSMLAQLGYDRAHPAIQRGVEFLIREQKEDGSWHGRWGVNYIYGTWSALSALNAVSEHHRAPHILKAAQWLKNRQRADGGWGEDCVSYKEERHYEAASSTPSQTAWALLGLMAAEEVDSEAVRRGISFLENVPRDGANWKEELFTGVGFPRVFFVKYYGYSAYFPLWALARYHNLTNGNGRRVRYGI